VSTTRRSWLRKHNPFESIGIRESIDNPQFVDGLVRSHDMHVSEHNPVAETAFFLCVYRKEYKPDVREDTKMAKERESKRLVRLSGEIKTPPMSQTRVPRQGSSCVNFKMV
jgi:hypothetical protein